MSASFDQMALAVGLREAARTIGCGRTKTIELIGAGHLDARKIGKKTVVTTESIRGFMENLPKANIRATRKIS